jgi:glycosyltransferase involved in cell wall biosynthesis
LIPCYNAEKWVGEAIQSALDQTYPNTEVIVVDDASTDGSLEVIKSFGDRIRWETGPNRGANAARNRLLELSRGEWLQYLDADDYLLPTKIETQIKLVRAEPADLVVSPCTFDDGSVRHWGNSRDPWVSFMRRELGITSANLWRKNTVAEAGGWNTAQPCGQESAMMLSMLMHGARVAYCNEALAVNRRVPLSISATRSYLLQDIIDERNKRAAEYLLRGHLMTRERMRAWEDLVIFAQGRLFRAGKRDLQRAKIRAFPFWWLRARLLIRYVASFVRPIPRPSQVAHTGM